MLARGVRIAWSLSALCLTALVLAVLLGHPSRSATAVLVVLSQLAAAAALALRACGERGQRAWGWALLVFAVVTYAWTSAFYILEPDAALRFPSVADASIALYPAVLAALVLFWRTRSGQLTRADLLDGAIAGLALAALDDALLIVPRVGRGLVGLATYGQVIYATGDVFLLGFLLAGGVLAEWPPPNAAPWFGLGLALMAVADTALAAHVVRDGPAPGRLSELLWAAGPAALAAAALTSPRRASGPTLRFAPATVPSVAAICALPVLITWDPGDDPARLVIALVAVILAGWRLALSLAANNRLLTAAEAGVARQATLAELGRRALAGEPLDALFVHAVRVATEGVGGDLGAVVEHDEREVVVLRAAYGLPGAAGDRIGGGAATVYVTRVGEAVIVEDWLTETRFAVPESIRRVAGRSAVLVPIRRRGGHAWALAVGSRAPGRFAAADAAFLDAVANVLGAELERLEAAEQLRTLAATRGRLVVETLQSEERERRRVAEGLHDLALQEVLAARQELDELDAHDYPLAARARDGLLRAGRGLREAVTELHPVVLEHGGLEPALDAVARREAQRSGFTYRVTVEPGVAHGREEALVSLARELLSNVAKHAHAHEVSVTVARCPGGVRLEVCDDGTGVEAAALTQAAVHGHIGLASWTERVEALGGTLTVQPRPGGGTCAHAELPTS